MCWTNYVTCVEKTTKKYQQSSSGLKVVPLFNIRIKTMWTGFIIFNPELGFYMDYKLYTYQCYT
jgi:hypothetical protein